MKDIDIYIENLFSIYKDEGAVLELKENLKTSLNYKYEDYLREGYNPDEALGRTIRNFGSMDELKEDLEDYRLVSEARPVLNKDKRENIDTIVWMLCFALYFFTGMYYGSWSYNWVIFLLAIDLVNFIEYKLD